MASFLLILIAVLFFTEESFCESWKQPQGSTPDSLVEKHPTAVFSGFLGLTGSMTEDAVDGFPDTKFDGGTTTGLALRVAFSKASAVFGIDASYYHFGMKLTENETEFGTVKMNWLMITPGVCFYNPETRFGGFFGIVGAGPVNNSFTKGEFVRSLEEESNGRVDVGVSKFIGVALLPLKFDYYISRSIGLGAGFVMLIGNADTDWRTNGVPISEINKLYVSNIQFNFTLNIKTN